jgi:hypothetical protein
MSVKPTPLRTRSASWLVRSKPKLALLGDSSKRLFTRRPWAEEKTEVLVYLRERISEQNIAYQSAIQAMESSRIILFHRLHGSDESAFLTALTQVRIAETNHDILAGMIDSLEYLSRMVENSDKRFDWRRHCDSILQWNALEATVEDPYNNISADDLKTHVRQYFRRLNSMQSNDAKFFILCRVR